MPESSIRLGWWLSSEEHDPRDLVRHVQLAESTGFSTAMVSDHLQPWTQHQGHAGHVWTTIGAMADATEQIEIGTGVTAMIHRSHPIDVAHAAATAAVLLEGRFFLGVAPASASTSSPTASAGPGRASGASSSRKPSR